jgi:hypothetical protein
VMNLNSLNACINNNLILVHEGLHRENFEPVPPKLVAEHVKVDSQHAITWVGELSALSYSHWTEPTENSRVATLISSPRTNGILMI